MARILSLGSALQDIYLIDHDDFVSTKEGEVEKLGQIVVGSKVDIDKISFEVGGGGVPGHYYLAEAVDGGLDYYVRY